MYMYRMGRAAMSKSSSLALSKRGMMHLFLQAAAPFKCPTIRSEPMYFDRVTVILILPCVSAYTASTVQSEYRLPRDKRNGPTIYDYIINEGEGFFPTPLKGREGLTGCNPAWIRNPTFGFLESFNDSTKLNLWTPKT